MGCPVHRRDGSTALRGAGSTRTRGKRFGWCRCQVLGRRAGGLGGATAGPGPRTGGQGSRVPLGGNVGGSGARRPRSRRFGRRPCGWCGPDGVVREAPVSGRCLTRTVRGVHPPVRAPRSGEARPPGASDHPPSPLRGTRGGRPDARGAPVPGRPSGDARAPGPDGAHGPRSTRSGGPSRPADGPCEHVPPLGTRGDTCSAQTATWEPVLHEGDTSRPPRFTCRLTLGHHPPGASRAGVRRRLEGQGRVTNPCSSIHSKATSAGSSPPTSTRRLRARRASSVIAGEI